MRKAPVLATLLVAALACGGLDVPDDDAGPVARTTVAQTGDPLVDQCQQAIACGCPNNPGDTVDSCVARWHEMMAWGTQLQTIGCFAQLDCASMCDISAGAGQRCALMMEQDSLAARAQIEQRAHETNMDIIRSMNSPTTEVYDENGVKLYEY